MHTLHINLIRLYTGDPPSIAGTVTHSNLAEGRGPYLVRMRRRSPRAALVPARRDETRPADAAPTKASASTWGGSSG